MQFNAVRMTAVPAMQKKQGERVTLALCFQKLIYGSTWIWPPAVRPQTSGKYISETCAGMTL